MASTSTPPIPSSVSSSTPGFWDVFLSFRGPDTRDGFISFLYKALKGEGIWTFKDAPELHSGEIIASALVNAIWNSKIHIVVLSQNYASSSWCLDELEEILKCSQKLGSAVIPVFYKIVPSVVRHQKGSFKTAFEKHEKVYFVGMDKLNKWRLTLSQVADFSGHHVDGIRSEADIVNEVVVAVLREINPVTVNVAKYPVGIESRVTDIKALLTVGTQGVRYIGIWGMGGVGKTTLAKAIYNNLSRNFEGSCFLANVSEVCGRQRGPESLQEQLIANVLKKENIVIHNADHGMELIKQRIRSKKVVVVVDDLNDQKQLDFLAVGSFGCGSVIILTTRHQDLLVRVGVEATYQYELNELDDADSQQLFNKHAFGDENPSDKYLVLSKEILHHAQGLPLALEIFGSSLCKQPEEEWRRFIGELKEAVNPNIQKKLVISFESLVGPTLKEMFLDIACFFVGCRRKTYAHVLRSCYKDVDANLSRLKSRCLIKIDDNNELSMHDLVRDMGWEIARNGAGKDEFRKHSRVFGWKDMYNVLDDDDDKKVNRAIKCMVQDFSVFDSSQVTFDTERFKRLPKLRFLNMKLVNLTGSFEHVFKDLTWLHWKFCPLKSLPSDFYPKKLVILEMPRSSITRWNLTKDLNDLKILDLSESLELVTVPDFSRLPLLESIDLNCCRKLKEVDTRIGDLKNLVSLDLTDCSSLSRLPDSVCRLTALESLKLRHCSSLEALPEELGNMTSLTRLMVGSPNILKLPDSIRRLTKLVQLELHVLKLKIPEASIFCFESLEILDIRCTELLPYGGFNGMFPPNLKQVTAIGIRSMVRLPNLSNLKQLERLELGDCSSLREIEGLEELISIKHLDLGGCISVTKLPNLSNLKQLEILFLTNCSSLKEIKGLEKLNTIEQLYLEGCNSFMVGKMLTESFFQIRSEIGNIIQIHIDKGDDSIWIKHAAGWYTELTEVRTNLCQEFTGLLLSFICPRLLGPEVIPIFHYQGCSPSAEHRYIYNITFIENDNPEYHISFGGGILIAFISRNVLIELRGDYDDEDAVFEIGALCRCVEDITIGVHQLYRPSHATTHTKRQKINI